MTGVTAFSGRTAAPFDWTGKGNHCGNTSTELADAKPHTPIARPASQADNFTLA